MDIGERRRRVLDDVRSAGADDEAGVRKSHAHDGSWAWLVLREQLSIMQAPSAQRAVVKAT